MKHNGSCHCGKVKYEVENLNLQESITCNCSMCQRKGTVLSFVPAMSFKLLTDKKYLTDYQFGKKMIHHLFCSTCGVTSFAEGKSPDGTAMIAINLRCIDNLDLGTIFSKQIDGRSF